jgi:hypothetical protein
MLDRCDRASDGIALPAARLLERKASEVQVKLEALAA